MTDAEKKDRDELISYAVKEGLVDVEEWTEVQKDKYYFDSLAYEPEE